MENKIIGIDPGLTHTGWGIIQVTGNKIEYIASGVITTNTAEKVSSRIATIFQNLNHTLHLFKPNMAAIEETYVNKNFESSLKLAQARAAAMLSMEIYGISPTSYQAKQVKKAVVGYGGADKIQMIGMINLLLSNAQIKRADEADAIAIAICHSSYSNYHNLYRECTYV